MRLVIIGGSDAGIEAGLTARALDPSAEVTLMVADRYPNYSICGIPYHVSGVPDWRDLAHRTQDELKSAGLRQPPRRPGAAPTPKPRHPPVPTSNRLPSPA